MEQKGSAGTLDSYLRRIARDSQSFNSPFRLRFEILADSRLPAMLPCKLLIAYVPFCHRLPSELTISSIKWLQPMPTLHSVRTKLTREHFNARLSWFMRCHKSRQARPLCGIGLKLFSRIQVLFSAPFLYCRPCQSISQGGVRGAL